ncbi:hypothetical protein P12x_003632 [Tundrisphaera lichenicola]|uniref:hypothetical protein n=1 Tax=Tundrisphaera lichenicola TaxID=2029860 RepID=UPI003EBB6A0B
MNSSLRNSWWGRIPLGFLGSMILILGVEWFLARHRADYMGASLWGYENGRKLAARKVKNAGLLAFGDSLIKNGFSPRVIRERTGLKGYNFAIAGAQAPASYFLLREALASGSRPKFVIVDFFPCLLSSDPWSNITHWPLLVNYRDCMDMAWQAGDSKLFANLVARKTLPSVRYRESIRAEILQSLRGFRGDMALGNQIATRHWASNLGLEINEYRHDPNVSLDAKIAELFGKVDWTPLNRFYVDRFMKLATDHGIKVVLLLPPYMPALQQRLEEVGFDAEHEKFVRVMLDRYPGMDVIDARKSKFEADVFIDINHLSFEGATNFSAEIGEILRRKQEGAGSLPRWSYLPTYRKRQVTVPHESVQESRTVVLRDVELRR